ncbi:hypothetical protein ASPVEDRAFT_52919 [Aspergillus versicolor CBS 583.65]|uniref:Protein kinase domain-containing protein n=1 Tax=Aspergillus versicolor CBS 583.65 TaxID=1036611 RepID=A0A1L9PKW8_ASPVE|nr:uncharacterized protein ASPVEDRAFT_52919 [Aspergillus versicolor CBS 583.65]OJJ02177.1 hypothetical protein ASPVEDRAFT_52919 [Aspergillus versicolor CBS 583.65]
MPSPGTSLLSTILVDKEISPVYNSRYFYPVKPGEILAGYIKEPERIITLKITNSNASFTGHERAVKEYISTADPLYRGRLLIQILLDSFEVEGLKDSHLCLIYPPIRELLSIYQQYFDDRKLLLPLIKIYIYALLTGLEYLYKEYRVVYTGGYLDLKLENIMVLFKDLTVLTNFMDS